MRCSVSSVSGSKNEKKNPVSLHCGKKTGKRDRTRKSRVSIVAEAVGKELVDSGKAIIA